MAMLRLFSNEVKEVDEDEVEVVISTDAVARDGHVLVPAGCNTRDYNRNPIVLWQHLPEEPIGKAEAINIGLHEITARIRFAPLGVSTTADRIRGLVKSGILNTVSVSFDPDLKTAKPIDRNKPRDGQIFADWTLLEISFVSVPSDTGAVVTARAHGDEPMPEVTQPAAEAKPAALRNRQHRANRAGRVTFSRGIYDISSLCYLFSSLGYQVESSKLEAAIEGDGSAVPGMLVGVLQDLGEALIAMTQEEVAEALAKHDVEIEVEDDGDAVLTVEERAHVAAASTPLQRAWRRGMAHAKHRAGKTLSAETTRCLREAKDMHEEAIGLCRSAITKHKAGMAAVDELLDRTASSDDDDTTAQTSFGTGSDNDRAAPAGNVRDADIDAAAAMAVIDDADHRRRRAAALGMVRH